MFNFNWSMIKKPDFIIFILIKCNFLPKIVVKIDLETKYNFSMIMVRYHAR